MYGGGTHQYPPNCCWVECTTYTTSLKNVVVGLLCMQIFCTFTLLASGSECVSFSIENKDEDKAIDTIVFHKSDDV